MRHGAFLCVNQQHHTIDHAQCTFYFTTEVRVAGGVDNIDVGAFPSHSAVLGQNRNAAFFFNGVVVHHGVNDFFVLSKRAGLTQQLIDHGGLAVVNVGDDRDVANLFMGHCFNS